MASPVVIPPDAPDWIKALPLIDVNGGHLERITAPPVWLWGAVYSVPSQGANCALCGELLADAHGWIFFTESGAVVDGMPVHPSCGIAARSKRLGRKATPLMATGSAGREWKQVAQEQDAARAR